MQEDKVYKRKMRKKKIGKEQKKRKKRVQQMKNIGIDDFQVYVEKGFFDE